MARKSPGKNRVTWARWQSTQDRSIRRTKALSTGFQGISSRGVVFNRRLSTPTPVKEPFNDHAVN